MYMDVLSVLTYADHMYTWCPRKPGLDLCNQLQEAVSYVSARNWINTGPLQEQVLFTAKPSLQLQPK